LTQDCDWVGYADADFSTPACEIIRLIEEISRGDKKVIMGSRIRRLGTKIHRSPLRHYLGRGFATFTSLVLKVPVYDTQCGAKLFQVGPPFREALAEPFLSAWIFDVEILGRLLTGSPGLVETDFMEVPLLQWNEVKGSRFSGLPMLYACLELAIIYLKLAGKRRALRKLLKLS
jgi:dolichyl-phosphate beta-glucosyltransferase